jgi:hypothetical protein
MEGHGDGGKRCAERDWTGLGSCPVASFGISGVETSGSATRQLVN